MNPRDTLALESASDAALVAACLAGERNGFARIVERYQRLLCALAYAATGHVGESEDLAQETFVAAWSQLRDLREPDKLRPWLCGILRHKVGRLRRAYGQDAGLGADPFEDAGELFADEPSARDAAMQAEEQLILRRALARVPALYREPLVLYYRENRSIEHVACALDLSEDAVKQRLARGRRMLQEQALAFVEGALERTTPGRAFTLGVLAALPAMAPAKGAALGSVVATQGGAIVKATGLAALLGSLSGVVSAAMQLRVSFDQSRTTRERRAVVRAMIACFAVTLGFVGLLWLLKEAVVRWPEGRAAGTVLGQVLVVGFIVAWPLWLARLMRDFRRLRSEERRNYPELFSAERDRVGAPAGVFRSRAALFGVPLLHVRFASPDEGDRPVIGWIAGGDRAYGLLFAWGALAVAPVSFGAFAAGFLAIGAVSVGVVALGTVGVGLLAVGAITVGAKAYAWLSALGWATARSEGFAVARLAAEGPVAYARHANDAAAHALLAAPQEERNQLIIYLLVAVGTLVPMALYAREVRRRLGPVPPPATADPRDD